MKPITAVRLGDIVRFARFSLRVEHEPVTRGNRVVLCGRISTDGCPTVERSYLNTTLVCIDERKDER